MASSSKKATSKPDTSSTLPKLAVGDSVVCSEYGNGVVRFFGPTDFSKGRVLFGVELTRMKGTSNGTLRHRHYFECPPLFGVFVPRDRITEILSTKIEERYCFGDDIEIPERGVGQIVYAGFTEFSEGLWYGIRLNSKRGKNNGSVAGVRYFKCKKKEGLFVKEKRLKLFTKVPDTALRSTGVHHVDFTSHSGSSTSLSSSDSQASLSRGSICEYDLDEESGERCLKSKSHSLRTEGVRSLPFSDTDTAAGVGAEATATPENDDELDYDLDFDAEIYRPSLRSKGTEEFHEHSAELYEEMRSTTSSSTRSSPKKKKSQAKKKSQTPKAKKRKKRPMSTFTPTPSEVSGSSTKRDETPESSLFVTVKSPPPRGKGLRSFSEADSPLPTGMTSKAASDPRAEETKEKSEGLSATARLTVGLPRSMSCADVDDARATVGRLRQRPQSRFRRATTKKQIGEGGEVTPRGAEERVTRIPTMTVHTSDSQKIFDRAKVDHEFKIVVIGGSRCGKTSIIRRFVFNSHGRKYRRSVGHRVFKHKTVVPVELREEFMEDLNMGALSAVPAEMQMAVAQSMCGHSTPAITESKGGGDLKEDEEEGDFGDPFEQMESSADSSSDIFADAETVGVGGDADESSGDGIVIEDDIAIDAGMARVESAASALSGVSAMSAVSRESRILLKSLTKELNVTLNIVDMGFHVADPSVFDNVNVVILVCDVTDRNSLSEAITKYHNFLDRLPEMKKRYRSASEASTRSHKQALSFIPVVVAANKCESTSRNVSTKELKQFVSTQVQPQFDKTLHTLGVTSPRGDDAEAAPKDFFDISPGVSGDEVKIADVPWKQTSALKAPRSSRCKKHMFTDTMVLPPSIKVVDRSPSLQDSGDFDDDELSLSDEETEFPTLHKEDSKDPKAKVLETEFVVSLVECDARSGKNVVKVFEKCIHKTLPLKLLDFSHKRQSTTMEMSAPLWLRQMYVDMFDMQSDDEDAKSGEETDDALEGFAVEWYDSDGRRALNSTDTD